MVVSLGLAPSARSSPDRATRPDRMGGLAAPVMVAVAAVVRWRETRRTTRCGVVVMVAAWRVVQASAALRI